MHNRYKHAFIATIAAAMPATLLAHNTAYKGLGTLFAVLGLLLLLGVLTLVLTIVNVFKKNRTMRIVSIILTIPFMGFSLFIGDYSFGRFLTAVSIFMIFLIYKSIPQKTPLPPIADNTDDEPETPPNP